MAIADRLGPIHSAAEEAVGQATLGKLWLGREPGPLGLEVQELLTERRPTVGVMRQAWAKRRALRANPVLIFWDGGEAGSLVCGPTATNEQSVPVTELPTEALATVLRIGLATPRRFATPTILDLLDRAQGSGDEPGFRNRGLVSTHCTLVSFERNDEARWRRLAQAVDGVSGKGGVELLRALGYSKVLNPGTFVHEQDGRIVVYATSLAGDVAIDRMDPKTGRTAAADLLALAREHHALRAVIVMGRVVRTYVVDQTAGDDLSTPATYVELDLDLLAECRRPLVALLAGANELSPNGSFDELAAESRRYAIALRQRFTRRVYDFVVAALVTAIHRAAPKQYREDPRALFDATLLLLYRLLFVLYAEDRNLLPVGNAEYRRASLTEMLFNLRRVENSGRPWDRRATEYWQRLGFIFDGVANGREEWNVPAYNGGLFTAGTLGGRVLRDTELPNAEIAPILLRLTFDDRDGESGKIDFSDLGIRYLGTLYEGLLAYDVRFADRDLALGDDEYVAAKAGDAVAVRRSEPYLITPQGGRKVSGTYFTPPFVVRRLIDEALRPALETHLERVASLPPQSQFAAMLEFRVVDPAMGSGPFLVDALDAIADRMNSFLRDNPGIAAKALTDAREHVTAMGKRFGIEDAGERVGDFLLLRRIVLKHCIYGVDLAPMAVELAKLSIWLHAFVPALPLSYLGHNLQHGDSLLGVVGTELDERFGGVGTGAQPKMFWPGIRQLLDDALAPARAIANRGDLSLPDVEESERLQHELEERLAPLRRAYDAYAARVFAHEARGPLEEGLIGDIVSRKDLGSVERRVMGSAKAITVELDEVVNGAVVIAREHHALHWELAFPEVFSGDEPGFDVVLGNPPWEEVTVAAWILRPLYPWHKVAAAARPNGRDGDIRPTSS